MSGTGGFAVSRSHGGDRFYNPPAMRRHQQMVLQQQQQEQRQQLLQQQRQQQPVQMAPPVEAGNRTDSDDSTATLSRPPSSARSVSPPRPLPANVTNLDRLLESVTPLVPAQFPSEVNGKGWKPREPESHAFYSLGDLWETFNEWSVYGLGVPLLLNGVDHVVQYYVPFLSGIQLYIDPAAKSSTQSRKPGEESDADSSRETSSGGSSDYEAADCRSKAIADGLSNQPNLVNLNAQRLNKLPSGDKSLNILSGDEADASNSPGLLIFEYLEQEQPHHRRPLIDKVSVLASQFPELRKCRSSDLLPASWICVAWYPIYRIPMGPTLRDLDASFLTFHSLSTHSKSNVQPQMDGSSGRKVHGGVDTSSKISIPAFALASYKLKGSILTPCGPHECEQENSLLQAAENWLRGLQVMLPDYQFFRSHYSQWR